MTIRFKFFGFVLPLAIAGGLALVLSASPANAQNCEKNPEHKNCSNDVPGDTAVTIIIDFDGAMTEVDAEGTVDCNNVSCVFNMTNVPNDTSINLPFSLRQLIGATEWNSVPLNPDQCFSGTNTHPNPRDPNSWDGIATITGIKLQLDLKTSSLQAFVYGTAFNTDDNVPRDYEFNFWRESLGETAAPLVIGEEFPGSHLISVFSKGMDKKFEGGPPCRCTISSTPRCPENVTSVENELPMNITIEEIN